MKGRRTLARYEGWICEESRQLPVWRLEILVLGPRFCAPAVFFVVNRLGVGDRPDSRFRRTDRRAVLARVRVARLKTDLNVGTGRFGFHSACHQSVLALIFGDDGVRRIGAQSPQREAAGLIGHRVIDFAARRAADGESHFRVRHRFAILVIDAARNSRAGGRGRSNSSVEARNDDPGSPATIGNGLSPTEATVLVLDAPLLGLTPPVCEQPAVTQTRMRRQSDDLEMRMTRYPPPGHTSRRD